MRWVRERFFGKVFTCIAYFHPRWPWILLVVWFPIFVFCFFLARWNPCPFSRSVTFICHTSSKITRNSAKYTNFQRWKIFSSQISGKILKLWNNVYSTYVQKVCENRHETDTSICLLSGVIILHHDPKDFKHRTLKVKTTYVHLFLIIHVFFKKKVAAKTLCTLPTPQLPSFSQVARLLFYSSIYFLL